MDNIYKHLFLKNSINEKQYVFLEAIRTNKLVSLYYELRLVLYLGIMLFTGGVGYYAYQNMGSIGHLISMALIGVSIFIGFYFIGKYAKPYSNSEVHVHQVYFDYILILVSLLIVSEFVYIQVYFDLVALLLNWTSFLSAAILLFMAYRYDNRALLSMGIAALAAAVGISITPVSWVKGEWSATTDLYVTNIILGFSLTIAGQISENREIKKHFRFTYQNFGLLLFYIGCTAAIFDSNHPSLYAVLMLVTAGVLTFYLWQKKEFLFFLYSNIAAYIALTYLLYEIIYSSDTALPFFFYYFPVSCIGYISFLITKKSHFAHD